MPLELWIPEKAKDAPRKIWLCRCGMKFPRPEQTQQFQRHALACAKKNAHEADEHLAAEESSIFTSIGDIEKYRWLRKADAEGRLKPGRITE